MANPDIVTMAVFGLGRIGSVHTKNIYQSNSCKLKYVLDICPNQLRRFAKLYRENDSIKILDLTQASLALNDPEVGAIVICTPTDTHEYYIELALTAGKHVFCEKPIAHNFQAIERCYKSAQQKHLILHCSMNRRYDPAIVNIYNSIRQGELGRVHIAKTCARDSQKPSIEYLKLSNGIFHDCGVHDVDMLMWLLNETPKKIYATSFTEDPDIAAVNDFETVAIHLTFESGTIGLIDLSRQSTYGYDQRVEVHGTKGMLQSLNQRPNYKKMFTNQGIANSCLKTCFTDRYAESYLNSLNDFIHCVRTNKPSRITSDEMLRLTRVLDCCNTSHQLQQVVDFVE